MKTITSSAPVRINDIGGWTDTWFAEKGKVLNLAVRPGVAVTVCLEPNPDLSPKRVLLKAVDFSESILMDPDQPDYRMHPMLQGAVHSIPVPRDKKLEISVFSSIPAASSTGTSAAVCVALLGALFETVEAKTSPDKIAALAHRVETEKLGLQSGIQDQICAAYGGICFIEMTRYPEAEVSRVKVKKKIRQELNDRISLIYLGKSHRSSTLHEKVITMLEKEGPLFAQIDKLRILAEAAADYLVRGELDAYGDVMIRNNECQRELHSGLISTDADAVISLAKKYHARGWKVNGAGGEGGSLTLLGSPDKNEREAMLGVIDSLGHGIRQIPVSLSEDGLVVS